MAAVVATIGLAAMAASTASAAPTEKALATFTVDRSDPANPVWRYAWTVPGGVKRVRFEVFGATGGAQPNDAFSGGNGGRADATFAVAPGRVFQIVIGGQGGPGDGGVAGLNGGGQGGPGQGGVSGLNGGGSGDSQGAGGGGGSDVRACEAAAASACGLFDRFIVAGGGGGAGLRGGVGEPRAGGAGGGLEGGDGVGPGGGGGGTQDAAGESSITIAGNTWGDFGVGGEAVGDGGGGGGGWFGGGGGALEGGGGGGSGHISGLALTGTLTTGVWSGGDGKIVIYKG